MDKNIEQNLDKREELFSSEFMYYSVSKNNGNWVEFQLELDHNMDQELLGVVANDVIKNRYPYYLQRLESDSEKFYLAENMKEILIYDLEQQQFLFGPKNNDYLFRIAATDNRLSFYFFHGLADARGFMPLVRTILFEYYSRKNGTLCFPENVNQIDSDIAVNEYMDPYIDGPSECEDKLEYKPDMVENPYQLPEEFDAQGRRFQYRLVVDSSDFMKFTKSEDGSPNVIIALFMANAILAVHPEASDRIVPGIAIDLRPALKSQNSHFSSVGIMKIHHKKAFENLPFTTQATCYRGRIFIESDKSVMNESVQRTIGACHYVNNIPSLEAKREMCRKIVSGQLNAFTFSVSYAGKSELGDIEQHIKSFYTNIDMKMYKMAIEINCTQNKFFFNIMQGFEDDCYVKNIVQAFEKEGIRYQYNGMKIMNDVKMDSSSLS